MMTMMHKCTNLGFTMPQEQSFTKDEIKKICRFFRYAKELFRGIYAVDQVAMAQTMDEKWIVFANSPYIFQKVANLIFVNGSVNTMLPDERLFQRMLTMADYITYRQHRATT